MIKIGETAQLGRNLASTCYRIRERRSKAVRLPRLEGIAPVSRFSDSDNSSRLESSPSSDGISPLNRLSDSDSTLSLDETCQVQARPRPFSLNSPISNFVTRLGELPTVTPCHSPIATISRPVEKCRSPLNLSRAGQATHRSPPPARDWHLDSPQQFR